MHFTGTSSIYCLTARNGVLPSTRKVEYSAGDQEWTRKNFVI